MRFGWKLWQAWISIELAAALTHTAAVFSIYGIYDSSTADSIFRSKSVNFGKSNADLGILKSTIKIDRSTNHNFEQKPVETEKCSTFWLVLLTKFCFLMKK